MDLLAALGRGAEQLSPLTRVEGAAGEEAFERMLAAALEEKHLRRSSDAERDNDADKVGTGFVEPADEKLKTGKEVDADNEVDPGEETNACNEDDEVQTSGAELVAEITEQLLTADSAISGGVIAGLDKVAEHISGMTAAVPEDSSTQSGRETSLADALIGAGQADTAGNAEEARAAGTAATLVKGKAVMLPVSQTAVDAQPVGESTLGKGQEQETASRSTAAGLEDVKTRDEVATRSSGEHMQKPTAGDLASQARMVDPGKAAITPDEGMSRAQRATAELQPARLPAQALRIVEGMRRDGSSFHRASMRLHPPELGSLRIELRMENEQVWARFIVESAAARDQVELELSRLKNALAERGLADAQVEVEVQQGGTEDKGHEFGETEDQRRAQLTGSETDGTGEHMHIARASLHDGIIDLRA